MVKPLKLIKKIKKLAKWLFRWLKYIVLIIICFIAYLFSGQKSSKLELKKEEIKKVKNKKNTPNNITTNIDTNKPLKKDTPLKLTKEELKSEIIKFYCQELEQKELYLTKEDFFIIDLLEEKIAPIIESELTKRHLKNLEEVKEKIEERGKIELPLILDQKILKAPIITDHPPKDTIIKKYPYKKFEEKMLEKSVAKKDDEYPIISQNNPFVAEKRELEKKTHHQSEISPNISQMPLEEEKFDLTLETSKIEAEIDSPSTPSSPNLTVKEASIKLDSGKILAPETASDNLPLSKPHQENTRNIKQESSKATNEEEKQIDTKKEETKEEPKEDKPKEEDITIALSLLEAEIAKLEHTKIEEFEKPNLEDKNYDFLLTKIDTMLKEIKDQQKMNLKPNTKEKLKVQELQLENMKINIENNLANDLTEEEKWLQDTITEQELNTLEQELKNIHLEHQIELNKNLLNKVEGLENLSKERLSMIKKELLKKRLNKICKTIELPSILLLPFFRNRYFFFFSTGIFINNHLHLLNAILNHQTLDYQEPVLEHIKKGSDALDEALNLTTTNIAYLNNLEQDILRKYPELSLDQEYLSYINNLKYSLIKNEEKMVKKKQTLEKYNLKFKGKVRKLKKKVA